mmetsp:Transcript_14565/g.15919  ORF Transcript_14565/g.15919 Transcript_14565/m.15919 type:complete len:218 (+) Transcript_14565:379-1032(+)
MGGDDGIGIGGGRHQGHNCPMCRSPTGNMSYTINVAVENNIQNMLVKCMNNNPNYSVVPNSSGYCSWIGKVSEWKTHNNDNDCEIRFSEALANKNKKFTMEQIARLTKEQWIQVNQKRIAEHDAYERRNKIIQRRIAKNHELNRRRAGVPDEIEATRRVVQLSPLGSSHEPHMLADALLQRDDRSSGSVGATINGGLLDDGLQLDPVAPHRLFSCEL